MIQITRLITTRASIELDPLVSSRLPCFSELPVKLTPPCVAPTATTTTHRRQHADEVASPCLHVSTRDQWPWPLERTRQSSAPTVVA